MLGKLYNVRYAERQHCRCAFKNQLQVVRPPSLDVWQYLFNEVGGMYLADPRRLFLRRKYKKGGHINTL